MEIARKELTASFEEIIWQREQESKSRESILQSEIDTKREQAVNAERKVDVLNSDIASLRNEVASLQRDLSSARRDSRVSIRKIDDIQKVKAEEVSKLQEERDRLIKEVTIAHDIGEKRVGEVIGLLRVAERALETQKEHFESTILHQRRSMIEREGTLHTEIEALTETARKYEVLEAKHCEELKQSEDQICKLESDVALERVAVNVARTETKIAHNKLKSAEEEVDLNMTLLNDARAKAETLEVNAQHLQREYDSTQHESSVNTLALEGSLREARDRVDGVEKRLQEAEEDFKVRNLAHVNEKEELSRRILYLEQCVQSTRDSGFSALNEGMADSPLFSDDMGPAFPLQKQTGEHLTLQMPRVEFSKLKEENDWLRQVISEMRRDIEELSRDETKNHEETRRRVKELEDLCTEQQLQLSAVKLERNKLMELSNSIRADLARVTDSAMTEEDRTKAVEVAVEATRREMNGKYKIKIRKIESAFRAVSEDNARLHDLIRKSRGEISSIETLGYDVGYDGSSFSMGNGASASATGGGTSILIGPTSNG